ncbi:cyclodeaminase/cyclohydrolase family protein [Halorubrum trueperi]|uniref:Cyclodeaminase/cyclohydrolase family protein n=1 Tax=Halorubrum trueperi TaxID=2004704 RepID=A0ABD5UF24_9EURY
MTYAERSVEGFLADVASSQVAPSAGATTALTGALAASLCEMVCLHTSEPSERLAAARAELRDRRELLLTLADEDAAAVDEVQTAFETTADDTHEQTALRSATDVPLRIAEAAGDVADRAAVVATDGTRTARTDAVVGAILARAAVTSAAAVVRENLGLLDDDEYVRETRSRIEAVETDAAAVVASVTNG